jgi:hypothetical protein
MFLFRYISIVSLGAALLAGQLPPGFLPAAPGPPAVLPGRPLTGIPSGARVKWIIQKTSSLSIDGHTNVSKFSCSVNEYTEPDTIACLKGDCLTDPQGIPLKGVLRINIDDFNCHNGVMTAEFKKTLKYKQYPQLKISFLTLARIPSSGDNNEAIKGSVDIELTGISRRFEIAYTSCRAGASELELAGTRTVGFSDFKLQPPRKMGGLIQVNDRLNVRFILYLKQVD